MITPSQGRMARAALQLGVREVAARAGVTPNTISRFENGADVMNATVRKLADVYSAAGIVFLPAENNGGAGVRVTWRD